MSTPAEKDRAKKGIKARNDAMKSLVANHQAEFDELVTRNRLALGLSRKPSGPTREQREASIKRAEEQIAKWRKELEEES